MLKLNKILYKMKGESQMRKFLKTYAVMLAAFVCVMCFNIMAYAAEVEGETKAIKLSKYSDLDQDAQDFNSGLVGGSIVAEADTSEPYKVYKITIPEDGVYRINFSTIENTGQTAINLQPLSFVVYSNSLLTKQVCNEELSETTNRNVFMTLTKGTYYVRVKLLRSSYISPKRADTTFSASFGYLPKDTEILKVTKSVNTTNKTVSLKIDTLDQYKLWAQEGTVRIDYFPSIYWRDNTLLSGNTYIITKNGTYTIRASDIYGNVYGKVVTINDFTKPDAPVVAKYKSGTKEVTGRAVENGTVTVTVGKTRYTAKADASGTYKVTLKTVLKVGTKITVSVKSPMDMVSTVTTVTVKNQKIATPKVTRYKKNTKVVKGTAKKNTTVYVKIGKKTYKGKASSKGAYSVKVPKLKKGTSINVYVKDSYGNYSNNRSVKVK